MPEPGAAAAAAAAGPGSSSGGAARSNRQSTGGDAGLPESMMSGSLDKFKAGVDSLQSMLEGLVNAAANERDALARERAALVAERRALESERSRVQVVLSDSEQVTLNVGGSKFTTTVSTLRNSPTDSLFAAMFSGRHEIPRSAADGSIFIDRDGSHFGQVLNYLRTRQLAYPQDGTDYKFLLELRAEAEFYGLSGLTAAIDRFPWSLVTVSRAACIEEEAHWVLEDGDDEVVISVSVPCQLLGVGLCGTHGGYTAQVHVMQVNPDDFEDTQAALGSGTRTVTRADGKIARLDLSDPVPLAPGATYRISMVARGADAFVAEDCLPVVVAGGVRVTFLPWESVNGTTETRGQLPELYIRALA